MELLNEEHMTYFLFEKKSLYLIFFSLKRVRSGGKKEELRKHIITQIQKQEENVNNFFYMEKSNSSTNSL